MNKFTLPLVAFTALVAGLAVGLTFNPRAVPSPLIDKAGRIRFKQTGPVTPDVLEKTILPLIKALNR